MLLAPPPYTANPPPYPTFEPPTYPTDQAPPIYTAQPSVSEFHRVCDMRFVTFM